MIDQNSNKAISGAWVLVKGGWYVAITAAVIALGLTRSWGPTPIPPAPIPIPVPASGIAIVGPETVEVCSPLDLTVDTTGEVVEWVEPASKSFWIRKTSPDGKSVVCGSGVAGTYRLIAHTSIKGKSVADARWITVGSVPPTPVPPGPVPVPIPPGPAPSPAPIPAPGFRVLIVYESSELSKLPKDQLAVLTSTDVRNYLYAKCVAGPDGKTTEWRIWDKDTDLAGESQLWREAMKRSRTGLPWLIISTGTAGWEGLLPKTIEETLTLLRKFGG